MSASPEPPPKDLYSGIINFLSSPTLKQGNLTLDKAYVVDKTTTTTIQKVDVTFNLRLGGGSITGDVV